METTATVERCVEGEFFQPMLAGSPLVQPKRLPLEGRVCRNGRCGNHEAVRERDTHRYYWCAKMAKDFITKERQYLLHMNLVYNSEMKAAKDEHAAQDAVRTASR